MKNFNDNEIAEQLRVVISRLVKIMKYQLRNDETLSLTEKSTLALVYQHSEIFPSELALTEKVTPQSMSQIINKLLKNEYIKKTFSKTDKRKVKITITSKGKKFVEKRRNEKREWLAQSLFEKTTRKEKTVLLNAIKVLAKLVDQNK